MTRFGIALALVCALSAPALAQNKAIADSLFDEGKKLMKEGKYEEACKKFEGSLEVLDRVGVQLNLADCYEKGGRTASAWLTFRSVESKAGKSGDTAKEDFAREHKDALEPMLARVTINLSNGADIDGLEVKLDKDVVPSALFGSATPIDPGDHLIEATAPGRLSWSSKVTVEKQAQISVEVPILGQETRYDGDKHEKNGDGKEGDDRIVDKGGGGNPGRTRKLIGLSVGGVGVVSLGVGIVFGLQASSKWSSAKSDFGCNEDAVCPTQQGVDRVKSAKSAALISTIGVGVGVAAIAGGVVLYLTAPKKAEGHAMRLTPVIGDDVLGVTLGGSF